MAMEEIETLAQVEDDWGVVRALLPEGWQEQASACGALVRRRGFADAEALLRTLLIHLADGYSLRRTVVEAAQTGLASVSDVALLNRLKSAGPWLAWLAREVMLAVLLSGPSTDWPRRRIRIVDGSTIQEPGSSGTSWRLHYALEFPSLHCGEVRITGPEVGESFALFQVNPGDLFMGDRGFASRANVAHVVKGGGDVLVRMNLSNLPLHDEHGERFALLAHLRTLTGGEAKAWPVWVHCEGRWVQARVCAVSKSRQAAERARRKCLKENTRKGRTPKDETLEATAYTWVFTTLDEQVPASEVLELYRGRWQVELVFKRLKSIVGLGHLKKTDPEAARAWIHGKLLVAALIEALIAHGERFSPWGYPLVQTTEPMARNRADAPSA
jgi:hypothetical protein